MVLYKVFLENELIIKAVINDSDVRYPGRPILKDLLISRANIFWFVLPIYFAWNIKAGRGVLLSLLSRGLSLHLLNLFK